jgi:hypothetical protein
MRQLIALILCAFSAASFAQTLQTVTTNGNQSTNDFHRSGINLAYDATRLNGATGFAPQIGLIDAGGGKIGGLTYINDGNFIGLTLSSFEKSVASFYSVSSSNSLFKQISLHSPTNNTYANGFVIRTTGPQIPSTGPAASWANRFSSNSLSSINTPLNIGVAGNLDVKFYATSSSDPEIMPAMTIKGGSQNIGINTAPSATYKLAIDGDAIATKMVVKAKSAWPDYVFKPNYELTPLSKIALFIKENGHLPEIPSEKEVTENGIDLGSMETKLLKKVEELTLYLLQQQQVIEKQQLQIDELVKKMKN